MPHPSESRRSARAQQPQRKRLLKRKRFWIPVAFLVLLIAAGAWLAIRGLQAKAQLEASVPLVSQLKDQLLAQDVTAAEKTLDEITPRVADARSLTSDIVWRAAEYTPFVGSNLTAVRELAAITDNIVTDAIPPLMQVAGTLFDGGLTPVDGGLNLDVIAGVLPDVDAATEVLDEAEAAVGDIDTAHTISQLTDAKATMAQLLATLTPALHEAQKILPIVLPALGSEGPRKYVVLFQNNAEARSLGGIPGAIVPLTVDAGKISLGAPADGEDFAKFAESIVPVPDGVRDLYALAFGTSILNSTVRPDFASAAAVVQAMWRDSFGEEIDGVISLDPVAMSYLLRGSGAIPLPSGDSLTSDNAVSLLLNDVYLRYPGLTEESRNEQGEFFAQVVNAVFGALLGGGTNPQSLAEGLIQAGDERRLLLWSANENEAALIADGDLNGSLPISDDKVERVGLYTQDAIGSKMTYYLKQKVTLSQASCAADELETYRISTDVTNILTPDEVEGLTFYIVGDGSEGVTAGDIRIDALAYAPPGSTISAIRVDGQPVEFTSFHDENYPVARVRVSIAPEQTKNITFDIVAGQPGHRELNALVTPLVYPTPVEVATLDCTTVAAR
ncbi:DUF4012 domain-containing protein [Cryobacterium sp. Y11]|uniref:DUF4012 domain-containing protein n=1 Tax=Cryobacterium sp. Y11 TaxID=2045016 RepID=UPI000CE4918E|nr:DUF4012 domain-containing protein [Cryobacterium sp. Y11]